jgi:hypothetical protein
MDYDLFYRQLFAPLEVSLGPIDRDTIVAIIGFDMGGPLNFCTIGREGGRSSITYVSCELAVRDDQRPTEFGRYELLSSCDDERWVRSIISDIGRMSLDTEFGPGHSMDIGPWVKPTDAVQGVVFEEACRCQIGGAPFGVLRVLGVTRHEMEYAQAWGTPALLKRLKAAAIYPCTLVNRPSVV